MDNYKEEEELNDGTLWRREDAAEYASAAKILSLIPDYYKEMYRISVFNNHYIRMENETSVHIVTMIGLNSVVAWDAGMSINSRHLSLTLSNNNFIHLITY